MVRCLNWALPLLIVLNITENTIGKKPNIILIVGDDVGQGDIPTYFDSSAVQMPNIDSLADEGLVFTDTHSTPLCAPSRYVLLSGNYQHRGRIAKGTWSIFQNHNQFRGQQKSIASALRDGAGYHTAIFGKWHLGGSVPTIPQGVVDRNRPISSSQHDWTLPLGDGPQDVGFDTSYITSEGIQRGPYSFFRDGYLEQADDLGAFKHWWVGEYLMPHGHSVIREAGEGTSTWDSSAYNMILVNETKAFIEDHLAERPDDPFFIDFSLGSVHLPHSPPDYYMDGTPIAGVYPDAPHLSMLLEMDKIVGSIISLVQEKGIEEDTMIIFTSDNGGLNPDNTKGKLDRGHKSGGSLRGNKGMIYEGGHRVPMIIRYDGILPKGERRDHLLSLSDIYATLCELAGIQPPNKSSGQDSVSFLNYAKTGEENDLRQSLGTWQYVRNVFKSDSLRRGNMKVIRNNLNSSIELYDLDKDLSESKNLSSDIRYDSLIKSMLDALDQVGPCPRNVAGKFRITDERGNLSRVGCEWFAEKKSRCRLAKKGKKKCPRICGRHKTFCKVHS